MNTVDIYVYNGVVGATVFEEGSFLNDISDENQLGVIVDVKNVSITQKAKDYIESNYVRLNESFSYFMLTLNPNKESADVGLIGGTGVRIISNDGKVEIGRLCDISVLDMMNINDDIESSEDYREFVEYVDHVKNINE